MENIPPGTPSLLLTLLEDANVQDIAYVKDDDKEEVQKNITAVVSAVRPRTRKPELTKDVAQQRLYDALYSIIKTEYDALEEDEEEDTKAAVGEDKAVAAVKEAAKKEKDEKAKENADLNRAIGLALETAIRLAEGKAPMRHHDNDRLMTGLSTALRKKIIAALKPKKA